MFASLATRAIMATCVPVWLHVCPCGYMCASLAICLTVSGWPQTGSCLEAARRWHLRSGLAASIGAVGEVWPGKQVSTTHSLQDSTHSTHTGNYIQELKHTNTAQYSNRKPKFWTHTFNHTTVVTKKTILLNSHTKLHHSSQTGSQSSELTHTTRPEYSQRKPYVLTLTHNHNSVLRQETKLLNSHIQPHIISHKGNQTFEFTNTTQ